VDRIRVTSSQSLLTFNFIFKSPFAICIPLFFHLESAQFVQHEPQSRERVHCAASAEFTYPHYQPHSFAGDTTFKISCSVFLRRELEEY
jgi:hypothetical protein